MTDFDCNLREFLKNMRNSILDELCKSNQRYMGLNAKSTDQSIQLESLVHDEFNNFSDLQYKIESFELNYYYLCGIRDSDSPKDFRAVDRDIQNELARNEKYIQLQSAYEEKHKEIQAILPCEHHTLLADYIKTRRMILDLEIRYSYPGAKSDKKQIDEYLNPVNDDLWEKLVRLFAYES